jgi:hypothetical protein
MNQEEWDCVFWEVLSDPALYHLRIVDYEDILMAQNDVLPGHRAVCFMDGENNAYVVFRGTYGDYEWADNGYGMLAADTTQQRAALRYVNHIRNKWQVKSLTAAGHSKGGNKAQYTAIVAPDQVDYCISVDGQGFSKAFFKKYEQNIKRSHHIILLAEQRDFVNCLGFPLYNTSYYRGWRGTKCRAFPYGNALPYFHCPDALRNMAGQFEPELQNSPLANVVSIFIQTFLTDQAYHDIRKDTIDHVIMLMMKQQAAATDQVALALAQLTVLLLHLLALDNQFNAEFEAVLFHESDVLIATLELFFSPENNHNNPLLESYMQQFAKLLVLQPTRIEELMVVLTKFVALLQRIKEQMQGDKKIFLYLVTALCFLLDGIILHSRDKHKLQVLLKYFKELSLDMLHQKQILSRSSSHHLDKIMNFLYHWPNVVIS